MNPRIIAGGFSFALMLAGWLLANHLRLCMFEAISSQQTGLLRVLTDGKWSAISNFRAFRRYRSRLPEGRLHLYAAVAFTTMMVGLLGVGAAIYVPF